MQRLFRFGRRLPVVQLLLPEQTHTTREQIEIEKEKTRAALLALEQLRHQFEEYRRRAEKRQVDARTMGIMYACAQMMEGIDTMSRAFEMVPEERRDDPWQRGMFLATREFAKTMRSMGMVRFGMPLDPNSSFDPHRYHAVDLEYRPDLPEGTILKLLLHGYLFRAGEGEKMVERLIRPAQVVVSTQSALAEKTS